MRTFVLVGHEAPTTGDFSLRDLPGGAGRLDVLVRCVTAAFLLSHDIRRDTTAYLCLLGPPDPPRTLRFVGRELRHLHPDERSTAALIRKALRAGREGGSVPGVYVRRRGLAEVLETVGEGLVYLREDGEDLRSADLPANPTFLLSDHRDLTPTEEELVAAHDPLVVRAGPVSLHADHVVVLVHNELDRRAS